MKHLQVTHSEAPYQSADGNVSLQSSDKMQSATFHAMSLRIGNWKRRSTFRDEITAKIYYNKRRIIWEIQETNLKYKIEFEWSHISAIEATYRNNGQDILKIELSQDPTFFFDFLMRGKKNWKPDWLATDDFTGNPPPTSRIHYLEFPEGKLKKPYEDLLLCDKKLKNLSQNIFPWDKLLGIDNLPSRIMLTKLMTGYDSDPSINPHIGTTTKNLVGSDEGIKSYQPVSDDNAINESNLVFRDEVLRNKTAKELHFFPMEESELRAFTHAIDPSKEFPLFPLKESQPQAFTHAIDRAKEFQLFPKMYSEPHAFPHAIDPRFTASVEFIDFNPPGMFYDSGNTSGSLSNTRKLDEENPGGPSLDLSL